MSEATHSRFIPEGMTRNCIDPWVYVEIRPDGAIAPCCVRAPIGNLAEQPLSAILQGDSVKALRRDLLTGQPDEVCRACGLKGVLEINAFQAQVRALRDAVKLPDGFDAAAYLDANPDVRQAGDDAVRHFLSSGRLEGRALRTAAEPDPGPALPRKPSA